MIINELVTLKLMQSSIEQELNDAAQDLNGNGLNWFETDWGRDLKFKIQRQIMQHYLSLYQEQSSLVGNVTEMSQNGTNSADIMEWINTRFKPIKDKTQLIKQQISDSLVNALQVFG